MCPSSVRGISIIESLHSAVLVVNLDDRIVLDALVYKNRASIITESLYLTFKLDVEYALSSFR